MYQRNRLEKLVQDVKENVSSINFLTDEFRSILESNIEYEKKCDYIGHAILSIENKINQVDEEMEYLKEYKHKLKEAKKLTTTIGAKVFNEYGITKIEGTSISSISLVSATSSTKLDLLDVDEKEFIDQGFYKKVLDKEKIIKSYMDGEYVEFIKQHAVITELVRNNPSRLRVNKRRINLIGDAA
jgi:hypothetical protein